MQALGIDHWIWDFWRPHESAGIELYVPSTEDVQPDANDTCWFHPPDMTCREFYNASHNATTGTALPVVHAYKKQAEDAHDTGADAKVRQFYTKEIADIVYDIYRVDFDLFGYERMELN